MARFGVDLIDLTRLGAVLRGELSSEDERLFAERHHRSILTAMNRLPEAVTFRDQRWVSAGAQNRR